ncbi:MAG: hypothetical protein M0Z78_05855 [Betaproteobacteria bacterium]|nr:hypothetical protein [Betaproteobacteria bacterium]
MGLLLWGFSDSRQMVIVAAETASEALSKAEKYWLAGQTITPLGALPLNAPGIAHQQNYKFDRDALGLANNNFFFEELALSR